MSQGIERGTNKEEEGSRTTVVVKGTLDLTFETTERGKLKRVGVKSFV